jgi:hypothetical protein
VVCAYVKIDICCFAWHQQSTRQQSLAGAQTAQKHDAAERTGVSHLPTEIRLKFNKTSSVCGKNEFNLKI